MAQDERAGRSRFGFYSVIAYLCLGIGFAGMFLPLLPTTIFWIIAAWLFAKAHPEMKDRIYAWPKVGPVVEDFLERGVIARSGKLSATAGITVIGGLSLWLSTPGTGWTVFVVAILAAVILFIVTRPESVAGRE